MSKILTRSVLGAVACLLATAGAARAQDVLDVKVPFPFVVKGQTFPAGRYTIERAAANDSVLMIRGDHGNKAAAFVATRPADGKRSPRTDMPAVQFTRHENVYRLSSIWESPTDGLSLIQ
jgi:hypothetical protein